MVPCVLITTDIDIWSICVVCKGRNIQIRVQAHFKGLKCEDDVRVQARVVVVRLVAKRRNASRIEM